MKAKRYSLAYWVKQNRSWDFSKDFSAALQTFWVNKTHPEIEFAGTPLEFANALYLEWMKRGKTSSCFPGFYPTPAAVADQMARSLALEDGDRVLDPGCGFGNLLNAVHSANRSVMVYGVEFNQWVYSVARLLHSTRIVCGDYLTLDPDTVTSLGPFGKAIVNPPFGKCYGIPAIEFPFMTRLAEHLGPNALVAALLPPTFWIRTTRIARAAQEHYAILEDDPLPPETFKPLTMVDVHRYVLATK